MAEHFSLRWNEYHTNMSAGLQSLLEDQEMVDVTLAASGEYVQAHKIILSVCSPYFKELFKTNPCKHPIVILKGVQLAELRHILHFMYKGEVNVRQQDLTSFLQTAELLQVKGLTCNRERTPPPPPSPTLTNETELTANYLPASEETSSKLSECSQDEIASDGTSILDDPASKSPLKRLLTNTARSNNNSQEKNKKIKVENLGIAQPSNTYREVHEYISDSDQMGDCDGEIYHSILENNEHKEPTLKDQVWNCKVGGVKCPNCHRFFANRYNLKVHIRDKHDTMEGTLQCEICQKRMRNPSCLRVHMYHHRKQAAFMATQQMSSMDSTSLDSSIEVKLEDSETSESSILHANLN